MTWHSAGGGGVGFGGAVLYPGVCFFNLIRCGVLLLPLLCAETMSPHILFLGLSFMIVRRWNFMFIKIEVCKDI